MTTSIYSSSEFHQFDEILRRCNPHFRKESRSSAIVGFRIGNLAKYSLFMVTYVMQMDKASVLAATITYIQELKERLNDLEQSNQRLKNQLLSVEQDQSSTGSPLLSASRAKGSPGRVSLRANSVSPTDEDMIKVSLDGNGNLIIEIRHPCSQPDTAMHIFACLKEMHFKVVNFNVAVYDNRIHASIIVKVLTKLPDFLCDQLDSSVRLLFGFGFQIESLIPPIWVSNWITYSSSLDFKLGHLFLQSTSLADPIVCHTTLLVFIYFDLTQSPLQYCNGFES